MILPMQCGRKIISTPKSSKASSSEPESEVQVSDVAQKDTFVSNTVPT